MRGSTKAHKMIRCRQVPLRKNHGEKHEKGKLSPLIGYTVDSG